MKDFKKSGKFGGDRGGRRDFGGKGGFRGGRDDRRGRRDFGGNPQMHQATCSECAKMCEVPFRPTGEKPVYCSECFGGKKGANDFGNKKDFTSRQSFSKPPISDSRIDDLKKDVEFLNIKLDRIIRLIENTKIQEPAVKKEMKKPVVVADLKKALKKAAKKVTKKKK